MTRPALLSLLLASSALVACGGGEATPVIDSSSDATPATEDRAAIDIPDAPESPLAEVNKKKAEAYLAENAAKDGVRTFENGLQMKTETDGEGPTPKEGDMLRFHFTGTLLDGRVLQDSRQIGEALVVPSPRVSSIAKWEDIPIPGVPLALAEMKQGERVSLVVPPELAYGAKGVPGSFEPYTILLFDLELVEIIADDERRAEVNAGEEAALADLRAQAEARAAEARAAAEELAAKNGEASTAFLAEVDTKDGVIKTESGLRYEIVNDGGEGETPAPTDLVTVHYRGTLPDGTEFDSSYSRGEPTSFPLNGVIAGWTEGVGLMNVGDTFRFYIPADLAYGARGAGANIGPDQALVFDVELLDIETAAEGGGQ